MTILSGDIKLMASQRMTDTTDGGGRLTGREIVSGEHNSIFPDISDLDRAYGVVNLRKVFLAVQTDDTDTYFGANATVLLPPTDPNVGLALMTTKDHHDTRDKARDVVERDLAVAPSGGGFSTTPSWKGSGRSASSSGSRCACQRLARPWCWSATRARPASSSSMCASLK